MITLSSLLRAAWQMFQGRCPGVIMVARQLTANKDGLEMIEYVVMAGLLVAAVVVTIAFFGDTIRNMFVAIANSISGRSSTAVYKKNVAASKPSQADYRGKQSQSQWEQSQ